MKGARREGEEGKMQVGAETRERVSSVLLLVSSMLGLFVQRGIGASGTRKSSTNLSAAGGEGGRMEDELRVCGRSRV